MDLEVAYNQPDLAYRKEPGVNQSSLKKILQSPAHYQAALKDKFLPSPAMEIGTAAHCLILDGPKAFDAAYVLQPDHIKLTTKDGKEWKAAQGRKKILKDDGKDRMWSSIHGMAEQLSKVDHYQVTDDPEYIRRNEVSIYWDWLGVRCKARLDSILVEQGIVLDLKTTASVDPDQFGKKVIGLGYDFQAAYYTQAAQMAYGKPFKFIFAAVERVAPYNVQLFEVTPDMMATGMAMCEDALHIYNQCTASGEWAQPEIQTHKLEYPRWHRSYQRRFKPGRVVETPESLEDVF